MSVLTFSDLAFMGAASGYTMTDADAAAYVARVEGASGDNQALENGVRKAIDDFVVGCKADGIWNAIKGSCILAGARTLAGALQPLVGTAPTNFNFVAGDYNRKTGLVGDGSTKYINSGITHRQASASATNRHSGLWVSFIGINGSLLISNNGINSDDISAESAFAGFAIRSTSADNPVSPLPCSAPSFVGHSRNSSTSFEARASGQNFTFVRNAGTVRDDPFYVFNLRGNTYYSNARIAFYSIGESLGLALLDARVTTLINAFGAAIP